MKPPPRLALRIIALALRSLPAGDIRRRYERELMAELYGLPVARQFRCAAGALLTGAC